MAIHRDIAQGEESKILPLHRQTKATAGKGHCLPGLEGAGENHLSTRLGTTTETGQKDPIREVQAFPF